MKTRNQVATCVTDEPEQLGHAPAMIVADLTCLPNELEAFACAICLGVLPDALQQAYLSEYSEPRTTYSKSRGGNKTTAGEGRARIDHILLNRSAISLTRDARVSHCVSAFADIARALDSRGRCVGLS